MKTILAAAAVLGFSVATASAGCAGHEVTTSVDTKLTVASIQTGTSTPVEDVKKEKAD